jgi:hypothetical protein
MRSGERAALARKAVANQLHRTVIGPLRPGNGSDTANLPFERRNTNLEVLETSIVDLRMKVRRI